MKKSSSTGFRRALALVTAVVVTTTLGACSGGSGTSSGTTAASPTLTSAPLYAPPGTGQLSAAVTTQLQQAVDRYVAEHSLVGVTAAVVTANGSWAGAAGKDGRGTALEPTSATMIASATKPFVAAEVLLLASRGKLDLDKPVTTYVDLPFDTGGATVRQLATMTSGFPDAPWDAMTTEAVTHAGTAATTQDMLARAADRPRVGTLGGPAAYNGLNYVVLGMVVEKVTGTTLGAAIRDDLLAPVGISRIWVQPEQKPVAPLAYPKADASTPVDTAGGYLPSLAGATLSRGGTGIAADAPSLARWAYLLYGGRVVDASLVKVMETSDPKGGQFGYGFGTMIADDNGKPFYGHAGVFVGYTSIFFVWTDPPVVTAVLVPQTGSMEDVRADLAVSLQQIVDVAG